MYGNIFYVNIIINCYTISVRVRTSELISAVERVNYFSRILTELRKVCRVISELILCSSGHAFSLAF
jgi:hypothetical protein